MEGNLLEVASVAGSVTYEVVGQLIVKGDFSLVDQSIEYVVELGQGITVKGEVGYPSTERVGYLGNEKDGLVARVF